MPDFVFVKGFKSIGGFYKGMMPPLDKMVTDPLYGFPTSLTQSQMVGSYFATGSAEDWYEYLADYYNDPVPYITVSGDELKQYLYDNGNSGTEFVDILEFRLKTVDLFEGETTLYTRSLVLSGLYSGPNDPVMTFKVRLKYLDPSVTPPVYRYTDLTVERGWRWQDDTHAYMFYAGEYTDGLETLTETGYLIGIVRSNTWGQYTVENEAFGFTLGAFQTVTKIGDIIFEVEENEESEEAGEASDEEGYGKGGKTGSFDFHSDKIEKPPKPTGISEMGFINIYRVGLNSLVDLGGTLFPDVAASTDVWEAISALSDSIWNSNLINYVISIHMVPGDATYGMLEDIKIGTRTLTGIMGSRVTSDYIDIDCGSIHTPDIYANFADLQIRCKLFLPFYGFVQIPPEYWNGGTIGVSYRINVVDGSFIAFVTAKSGYSELDSIIGQYSGCACIQCPASGVAYSSMFGGMVAGGVGMAASAASGNIAGLTTSLLSVANATQGTDIGSNTYNASASFMGIRKPYLIIEAPVPQFSTRYVVENGLPAQVTKTLGTCKGFTTAENAILDGIPCTDDEKNRIREALKTGLIF